MQQLCLKGSKHCSPASGQSPWCKGGNGDPPWAKTPPYSPSGGDAVRRQNLHTAWCSVCPRLGRGHEWAPNLPKEMIWTHEAQLETSPTELQWSLEVVPLNIQAGTSLRQADTRVHPGSLLHEVNPVQADEQGNQIYKHLFSTEVCALLGKFCHLIYLFIKSFIPLINNR